MGMAGVLCRYSLQVMGEGLQLTEYFPLTTFLVNTSGAFLAGIIYVLAVEHLSLTEEVRAALLIGFLGGFTTFSAYCLETHRLLSLGQYLTAGTYFFLSPLLGLVACYGGVALSRHFLRL